MLMAFEINLDKILILSGLIEPIFLIKIINLKSLQIMKILQNNKFKRQLSEIIFNFLTIHLITQVNFSVTQ
jgi:hypothetical protein